MNVVYREARADDAIALLEHINTVGKETDFLSFGGGAFSISPEKEARFIERFHSAKNDLMLIAVADGRVLGNGVIESERIPRFSHRATLSVTVLADFWGMGIGSELVRRLIEFSRSAGISTVSLEVRSDNARAISLYKKFGFRKIGVYERYFKIADRFFDADLMQITL